LTEIPAIIADAGFSSGEMAEWLKALVLKVLDESTNPANTGVPPMVDIGFFLFWQCSDGKMDVKKLPSGLRNTGWQALSREIILMARAKD
jgi:hypothetical protein